MAARGPAGGLPRGKRPADVLERIKRLVATYPDAPAGIEHYTWFEVPRYWESLVVPVGDRRRVRIVPRHEDRHAGVAFRVGWDEAEQIAAVWIL
jgi:hypothetical protein